MLNWIIKNTIGTKHDRDVKGMRPLVAQINSLEKSFENLDLSQFQEKTDEFRKRYHNGESIESILPESFALVREAAKRTLNMRHFDVQLMGGIVLHQGKISEMKTGEGKTLVATLSVYLNAITGKGVHVVTVNDYLARRDANWMRPIYEILGMSVGIIQHDMNHEDRKAAYAADITYGTNNEFGFDYLRDNMVLHPDDRVQRPFHYAIVDEVDSILIDEARTPLIISGPAEESTDKYYKADKKVILLMRENVVIKEEDLPPEEIRLSMNANRRKKTGVIYTKFYELDEKGKNVILTEEGNQRIEELLEVGNLYEPANIEWVHAINQALKAHTLFHRDVDYVVKDGEVIIVDEFTGRLMPGRRYSDGMHQALEAKEGVKIAQENQTLASITFQNLFRKYKKLAGMTGTADTESVEFKKIYNLDVVVVPTNRPMIRMDYSDRIYRTEREKFDAIVSEILDAHQRQQPCLVGTISIEKSELLGNHLKKNHIPHNILNAKFHEKEAEIISEAGIPGKVTIATNMAGRGTDIVLGGSKTFEELLEKHDPVNLKPEKWEEFKKAVKTGAWESADQLIQAMLGQDLKVAVRALEMARQWQENHEIVKSAGGLHIIGTERHESRRIDNQLRGRSGRQGDPGSSRFYLSLEDNLMRIFGSERISNLMKRMGMEEGQEIEHPWVTKAIANAQKRVEGHNFEIRKHLLEYDEAMNAQREKIYDIRNFVLDNEDVSDLVEEYLEEATSLILERYCGSDVHRDEWDTNGLYEHYKNIYSVILDLEEKDPFKIRREEFSDYLLQSIRERYTAKKEEIGDDRKIVEKMVILQVLDTKWKDHLYSMDHLREGIWTASYSERNPLVEYKREGFSMFRNMIVDMQEEIVSILMRIKVENGIQDDFFHQMDTSMQFESRESVIPATFTHPQVSESGNQGGYSIDSSAINSSGTYVSPERQKGNKEEKSEIVGASKRKKSRKSRGRG